MNINAFDIIGPIMIGPSSSHTAGAVRLGNMARIILDQEPVKAEIFLHGSFAETYRGHGTDLALVAGLLGLRTDDSQIPQALDLAAGMGVDIKFFTTNLGDVHPNSVRIYLTGNLGRSVQVTGSSIGGGRIKITEIDDFPVEITGDYNTLIVVHKDQPGVVASITALLAAGQVNIAQIRLSRQKRDALALDIMETDHLVDDAILNLIRKLPAVSLAMTAKPLI